jgi:hypothetical protein
MLHSVETVYNRALAYSAGDTLVIIGDIDSMDGSLQNWLKKQNPKLKDVIILPRGTTVGLIS